MRPGRRARQRLVVGGRAGSSRSGSAITRIPPSRSSIAGGCRAVPRGSPRPRRSAPARRRAGAPPRGTRPAPACRASTSSDETVPRKQSSSPGQSQRFLEDRAVRRGRERERELLPRARRTASTAPGASGSSRRYASSISSTTSRLICLRLAGDARFLVRGTRDHSGAHIPIIARCTVVVVPAAALAHVALAHGVPDLLRLEQDAVEVEDDSRRSSDAHCNFGRVPAISSAMADDRERFERIYRENFRAVLRFAALRIDPGAGEGRRGGDLPRRVAASRRRSGRARGRGSSAWRAR